jgi:hypothetical protein
MRDDHKKVSYIALNIFHIEGNIKKTIGPKIIFNEGMAFYPDSSITN